MSPKPSSSTPLLAPTHYPVDHAIEHLGVGPFQKILLLLAGLCWTAESMEMLILSFIKLPLQCDWKISDAKAAFITTSVAIGMLSGATSWGVFSDRYGRRAGFIASTAFTFLFGLISAASPNYHFLVISRGLVGFGIGGVPVSFSLLMEFLPSSVRGKWGLALAFFWALGAIFESIVALFIVPTLGWRWLIVVSSMPLGIVLLLSWLLVESPRWLIAKGRTEEARRSIQAIADANGIEMPQGELRDVVSEGQGTVAELLTKGARGVALKIWFLWFVVAFVYYGHVMLQPELIANENTGQRCNYATMECARLGEHSCADNPICRWTLGGCAISTSKEHVPLDTSRQQVPLEDYCARQLTVADYMSTLWASVGEMPGVIVAFLVIDSIGRRPLLGYTYATCAVSFVVLLACIGRQAETLLFFMARGASSGAFQAIYVYTNEIYPSVIRATAMGVSSSMARAGLTLTPFVAQYVENFDHALAMWIYFALSVMAVVVVMWIPIETTQRPLISSIDELVILVRDGEKYDEVTETRFASDPSVSRIVKFFRWSAKVDGKVPL